MASFSERFGHRAPEPPITVRNDAPKNFRGALVMLGYEALGAKQLRDVVCSILLEPPDASNWSSSNVLEEVRWLVVSKAEWPQVYEVAEALYQRLLSTEQWNADAFEEKLNQLLVKNGLGYVMNHGAICARGSEVFAHAPAVAVEVLKEIGTMTASAEMQEAMRDISRRPPDLTGAVHHSMNALECLAKQLTGNSKGTLGQMVAKLDLPKPLDAAVEKLWGYASQSGRHIAEGGEPTFEDAEFIVTVAAGLCTYLARRQREA
jgi:hypothetical protein